MPLRTSRALPPLALALAMAACAAQAAETGTLAFFVNGEALATGGFTGETRTRDGWELTFDHIYLTLDDVAAHRTDPPFEPGPGAEPNAVGTVALPGPIAVDLLATGDDGRVRLGAVEAPAGHYNALTWSIVPPVDGARAGQSMTLVGTATRDGETVAFTLVDPRRHVYRCGEYVGDSRKGFVTAGAEADVEMTLHLDHLFGRSDLPADDPMNVAALGFDPFASGGAHVLDVEGLHMGHVGEGHCDVTWR